MDTIFSERLPRDIGIRRWADAASHAGAMLPDFIRDFILRLDWDAEGYDRIDMYDIVEAVADACRECQEQHVADCEGTYHPCPRGVEMYCGPCGQVEIIWASDSHTTTLGFCAEVRNTTRVGGFSNHGYGLMDYVVLTCESELEDSPRIRACRGESLDQMGDR